MSEISLETLEVLIKKGRELKQLLKETPEILEYLRLLEKFSNGERSIIPIPTDKLVKSGEAAEVLGVNKATIDNYSKAGILTPLYTAGSNHKKFWLSEVKAVAKKANS